MIIVVLSLKKVIYFTSTHIYLALNAVHSESVHTTQGTSAVTDKHTASTETNIPLRDISLPSLPFPSSLPASKPSLSSLATHSFVEWTVHWDRYLMVYGWQRFLLECQRSQLPSKSWLIDRLQCKPIPIIHLPSPKTTQACLCPLSGMWVSEWVSHCACVCLCVSIPSIHPPVRTYIHPLLE